MISDDICALSARLAGHALHNTAPTREELAAIAAELAKFSGIVRTMESLPLEVTLSFLTECPEYPLARIAAENRP